jgi:flagellar biosynthesis anti-sigma factor FlgM
VKISGRKGGELKSVSFRKTKEAHGASTSRPGKVDGVGEVDSTVAISDRGRTVSEARRIIDALPDIRVDKVAQIQDTMEKGMYRVDGEKVAEKMVTDAVREIRKRTRGR